MSNIGTILKSLRIRDGLTQEELADKTNLSRSTIAAYERDSRMPPKDVLELLADIFNVDMNFITGYNTDEDYYIDLETKQIAQEIFDNKELRALFDASRNASAEDLEITRDILLKLKKKERGDSID